MYGLDGIGGIATFEQARVKADRVARERNETRYVIREGEFFYVATNEDLETFFFGTRDENILYVTEY